jgi:hypothetical protein
LAALKSPARKSTWKDVCRCTRSVLISIIRPPQLTRPMAASASKSGSAVVKCSVTGCFVRRRKERRRLRLAKLRCRVPAVAVIVAPVAIAVPEVLVDPVVEAVRETRTVVVRADVSVGLTAPVAVHRIPREGVVRKQDVHPLRLQMLLREMPAARDQKLNSSELVEVR